LQFKNYILSLPKIFAKIVQVERNTKKVYFFLLPKRRLSSGFGKR